MPKTIGDFYTETDKYVSLFNSFAQKHTLAGSASADHICYKCGSRESFEAMRLMMERESEFIYQSIISKRPIAYLKLKKPIETDLGSVYFLELSDQKPDGSQAEGFDHIEAYPTQGSYQDMVQKLEAEGETVVLVERPHHTTHDIDIGGGFLYRCTPGPLIEKIRDAEMH